MERSAPHREIGVRVRVRVVRACVRVGEAKLRGRARGMTPPWLGRRQDP